MQRALRAYAQEDKTFQDCFALVDRLEAILSKAILSKAMDSKMADPIPSPSAQMQGQIESITSDLALAILDPLSTTQMQIAIKSCDNAAVPFRRRWNRVKKDLEEQLVKLAAQLEALSKTPADPNLAQPLYRPYCRIRSRKKSCVSQFVAMN